MTATKTADCPVFPGVTIHRNLSTPSLVEAAVRRGEGELAANGALCCSTGERTGRSPKDKYLEDTPEIHDTIEWGAINKPISPENFAAIEALALSHLATRSELYRFDGHAGADPRYRLNVSVITERAWHSLFAKTLFINAAEEDQAGFASDWTIINACDLQLEDPSQYGVDSPLVIIQSLTQRKVIIVGTQYAGEMKKSIFYGMNYDLPDMDVFPMHCSANIAAGDDTNVALFFGLSGTGKTTLSADPDRPLVGDDEHGWSDAGVFNIEGGCYAKCIKLSREGEPQIWNAIRFGSVLENVVLDDQRVPDYDSAALTENTRVTYPVTYIPGAKIPSVGGHPNNVIFLTADAFGVLPPISRLTPEQSQYYFINGYTSKLAGTEEGVTEPTPNFSPCFGGPFLPRPAMVYASMLADRVTEHGTNVWLLNTGWIGGGYGEGKRCSLAWTRRMVEAILSGELDDVQTQEHPIFGLYIPTEVQGVPSDVLDPVKTWEDEEAYALRATDLAARFRANDANFEMDDAVRAAGPKG
jgi:phosphoenolpyruvate carboxykinase (ATP)